MSNEPLPTIPYRPLARHRFLAVVLTPPFVFFALLSAAPVIALTILLLIRPDRFRDDLLTLVVAFSLLSVLAGAVAAFLGSMMFHCLANYEVNPSSIVRRLLVWRRSLSWREVAWLHLEHANDHAHSFALFDHHGRRVMRVMLQFFSRDIAENLLAWVEWYTTVPMNDTLGAIQQRGRWFRYRYLKLAFPEITTVVFSMLVLALQMVPGIGRHWFYVMLAAVEILAIADWSREFGASYWVDQQTIVRKRFGSTVTVPLAAIQSVRYTADLRVTVAWPGGKMRILGDRLSEGGLLVAFLFQQVPHSFK